MAQLSPASKPMFQIKSQVFYLVTTRQGVHCKGYTARGTLPFDANATSYASSIKKAMFSYLSHSFGGTLVKLVEDKRGRSVGFGGGSVSTE